MFIEKHSFIFLPGKWLGEGKIRLSLSEEELYFFMRWNIKEAEEGVIVCTQEIQVKGLSEVMVNHLEIFDVVPSTFLLRMENHAVGKIEGKGVISDALVGWEFRMQEIGFEGFELYEKLPNGTYQVRGEFASGDLFRTQIDGKIWKQTSG